MSSAPIPPPNPEELSHLSPEEWWDLFDRVRLRMQPAYAELGGAEVFLREERDTDAVGA